MSLHALDVQPSANLYASRAMLVSLSISEWTARRLDKRVTDSVNVEHGAGRDVARVNKLLVPAESLKAISSAVGAARTFHYARTLPWLHKGADLLTAMAYADYTKEMKRFRREFDSAVDSFLSDYPRHKAEAAWRMGSLYNATDYPSADALRYRFRFAVAISPVPSADDFRVDIGNAEAARVKEEIESRTAEAFAAAQRDVWTRIEERVRAMAEKLTAFKPSAGKGDKAENIFRDSLVENVRELVGILPSLNLTGDSALTQIAARMEKELCAETADDLRANESARESVAKAAESILADVSNYLA